MPPNVGGFRKAITSLSFIEGKLRRALGLVGDVGATFQPNLTPIIIAGDLREPGNTDGFTGRAWSYSSAQAIGGATPVFSVRFDADVFIDGIWMEANQAAANAMNCYITVPGQATGATAPNTNCGTWIDRRVLAVDPVPMQHSAVPTAVVGTAVSDTNRIAQFTAATPAPAYKPIRMMLAAGSALNFYANNPAGSIFLGCHGRMWP